MKRALAVAAVCMLAGCTEINVHSVDSTTNLGPVCIVRNPQVTVSDFLEVLRDGFNRHHIATSVVDASDAHSCETTLTYTALRTWDFKPYISYAELRLSRNGSAIGSAEYRLRGKGGLDLNKWGSTREKMIPVIDQLLAHK